jgi:low temperature requirement protein LtrA
MGKSIVSPEAQSATFVELFFDLVFVFAITQMVGLLHHDLSWTGAGKAILVFWMVWWAWTQFTWALNAANTDHVFVQLGTLIATALAFFMAVAVPEAFGDGALWFAVTYAAVRVVGLGMYGLVALHTPGLGGAVKSFAALSVGGLACAVVGGVLGGPAQLWLWGLTIFLDFVAAATAGESDGWNLRASHFAERHGLIVIIALGESLIVAAAGVVGTDFSGEVLLVAVLAVLVSVRVDAVRPVVPGAGGLLRSRSPRWSTRWRERRVAVRVAWLATRTPSDTSPCSVV